MAMTAPEFARSSAWIWRPGGFGPRPEVTRALVKRTFLRARGWPTMRGRGGRDRALGEWLASDEPWRAGADLPAATQEQRVTVRSWITTPAGRPSWTLTFREIRLCRYVAWFFEQLRLTPRGAVAHLATCEDLPPWLAAAISAAHVDAALVDSDAKWQERRNKIVCDLVAELLGVSPRTFQEKVRRWRDDRIRRFEPSYRAATSDDERAAVVAQLQTLLNGEIVAVGGHR